MKLVTTEIGCHASSPVRRGEACFARGGQSMAPVPGAKALLPGYDRSADIESSWETAVDVAVF